ncbi:ATP-binding protein [Streptomyces klenkii]|uniref:ATP-binding protein n=1 Tax=Streptomyces klenkii TaxID=1420899 RepID=UPI003422B85D
MPSADIAYPPLGALMDHHAFDLDGVRAPQQVAREKVRETCSKGAQDDIALVASELVGNALQHTDDGPLELTLDIYQRGMAVGVADGDPDVTAVPVRPAQPPAPAGAGDKDIPEGGRGLFLVDLCSTERTVEQRHGGKVITAFIPLAGGR